MPIRVSRSAGHRAELGRSAHLHAVIHTHVGKQGKKTVKQAQRSK
jgi:hypothetical protein